MRENQRVNGPPVCSRLNRFPAACLRLGSNQAVISAVPRHLYFTNL